MQSIVIGALGSKIDKSAKREAVTGGSNTWGRDYVLTSYWLSSTCLRQSAFRVQIPMRRLRSSFFCFLLLFGLHSSGILFSEFGSR